MKTVLVLFKGAPDPVTWQVEGYSHEIPGFFSVTRANGDVEHWNTDAFARITIPKQG
jgi:hypothetical protein